MNPLRTPFESPRALFLSYVLFASMAMGGCATEMMATKPAYPALDPAFVNPADASTFQLENQLNDSPMAMSACVLVEVSVDGFSPTPKKFVPQGTHKLQLPPGSHELVIQPSFCGNSIYYFNPIKVVVDTEPAKTYSLRFVPNAAFANTAFYIVYNGWSRQAAAAWPREVKIANPLF